MRPLTTDMTRGDLRPYFLWDEDVSIDELRAALAAPDGVKVDPPDEILANKLTTLVSRAEAGARPRTSRGSSVRSASRTTRRFRGTSPSPP